MTEKWTERRVLDHLHEWYSQKRGMTSRYAVAEHVRAKTGRRNRRTIDFMATDLWPGRAGNNIAFHGHEVKVSRSDWLTELRDPTKAEAFKPYVHHWWLVVSDPKIVKPGELPDGWGLIAHDGFMKVIHPAPKQVPKPMPAPMLAALLRATATTATRRALEQQVGAAEGV